MVLICMMINDFHSHQRCACAMFVIINAEAFLDIVSYMYTSAKLFLLKSNFVNVYFL